MRLLQFFGASSGSIFGDVVWADPIGVSVAGNTLTKTSATTSWASGQAHSVRTYPLAADFAVEFTADSTSTKYMGCGFGYATTLSEGLAEMEFGLFSYDGNVNTVEAGAFADRGAYTAGHVLRVEKTGTTIKYYSNGVLLHTSVTAVSSPVYVLATIYTQGNHITDATIAV